MKLFIRRETSGGTAVFGVFDELGYLKYTVESSAEKRKQRMLILDSKKRPVSEILHKQFVLDYYTIRCGSRLYVLVPYCKECFSFAIYGSTYRFSGNLSLGEFIMKNADDKVKKKKKKVMTSSGEAFELEIDDNENRLFMISAAVCAASYQVIAEPNTPQVCC